ncbi:DUF7544 domain-containing protein [Haloarcula sp. AONF1]
MSWHAVEAADRAVRATRRFLFPFEAVRWAKLAFLAPVMAGGGAGTPGTATSSLGVPAGGVGAGNGIAPIEPGSVPPGAERVVRTGVERVAELDPALLAGLALGAVFVVAVLSACSIAFRLVFYEALSTTEAALWGPFRDRFRQGLGLFGFAAVTAVVAGLPAVALAATLDPDLLRVVGVSVGRFPGWSPVAPPLLGALGVLAGATALAGTAVSRLTFEFVAPAMVARDVGVVAGWREVWASFRGSWAEVVVYVAVHAVLAVGVGIVQAVAAAVVGGVVAVTGLVALLLAAVPLGGFGALIGTTAGAIVLATVLVCAVVAVVVLTLPVTLVARTYLTAFEVSTLAGIDSDLAPLAPALVASDESGPVAE